jgi:hypothetical protein
VEILDVIKFRENDEFSNTPEEVEPCSTVLMEPVYVRREEPEPFIFEVLFEDGTWQVLEILFFFDSE